MTASEQIITLIKQNLQTIRQLKSENARLRFKIETMERSARHEKNTNRNSKRAQH